MSLSTKIKDKKSKRGPKFKRVKSCEPGPALLKDALEVKTNIKMKCEKRPLRHIHVYPSPTMIMELGSNRESWSRDCTREIPPAWVVNKCLIHAEGTTHSTVLLISVLTASGAARDLRGNRSSLMFICPVQFSSTFHNVTESDPHPLCSPRQKATVYMDTLTNGWHHRPAWMAGI